MKYVFYHNDGCKLAGRGFECRKIISLVVAASTLVISSSAVAQSDRAERQFQRAVEQKQQNEAVENEKDRKLLLEMARMC